MTYVVTKYIKGNPYLYEVKSVREGDRVRQVFVRYLGRADKPSREYSETEPVERKERIRRPAVAVISEAVAPTVKASNEITTISGRRLVAPKIRVTSDILAKRDSLKADEWLLNEAKKELEPKLVITGHIPLPGSPGDKAEFQMGLLKGINPKKMTQADKDTAWEILTGEPNAPSVFELVETKPIVKPTPEVEVPAPKIAPEQQQVFYHGSDAIFDIKDFKAETKGTTSTTFGQVEVDRHGIFLSESPEFASEYGKKVTPIKTNIKNTADIQVGDNPSNAVQGFIDSLDPFGSDRDLWLLAKNTKQEWGLFDGELGARFTKYLKEQGFDSARFEEYLPAESTKVGYELQGHTLVVLDPNVISTPTPEVVTPTVAVETEIPSPVKPILPVKETTTTITKEPWQMERAEYNASIGKVNTDKIYYHATTSKEKFNKFTGNEVWFDTAPRDYGENMAQVQYDWKNPFITSLQEAEEQGFKITSEQVAKNKEIYERLGGEANPKTFEWLREQGYDVVLDNEGYAALYPERVKILDWAKAENEFVNPNRIVKGFMHKAFVEKAIKEGKPIPAEVLKDYPELAPKPTPEVMVTPIEPEITPVTPSQQAVIARFMATPDEQVVRASEEVVAALKAKGFTDDYIRTKMSIREMKGALAEVTPEVTNAITKVRQRLIDDIEIMNKELGFGASQAERVKRLAEIQSPERIRQYMVEILGDDPTIRLYRGIGAKWAEREGKGLGQFWTSKRDVAEQYARGQDIFQLDVKASEVANRKLGEVVGGREAEYRLTEELTKRAIPKAEPIPVTPEVTKPTFSDNFGKGTQAEVLRIVGSLPPNLKIDIKEFYIDEALTKREGVLAIYYPEAQAIIFRNEAVARNPSTVAHEIAHQTVGQEVIDDYGKIVKPRTEGLRETFAEDFGDYVSHPNILTKESLTFFEERFPKAVVIPKAEVVTPTAPAEEPIIPKPIVKELEIKEPTAPVTPEVTKIKLGVLTETEADYLNSTIHGMYHDYKAGEPITASIETYLDEMPSRVLSPERKAEIAIERKVDKLRDKIEKLDERIEAAESAGKDTKILEKQRQILKDETLRLEGEVISKSVTPEAEMVTPTAPAGETTPRIQEIQYSRDLDIRNIEA